MPFVKKKIDYWKITFGSFFRKILEIIYPPIMGKRGIFWGCDSFSSCRSNKIFGKFSVNFSIFERGNKSGISGSLWVIIPAKIRKAKRENLRRIFKSIEIFPLFFY
ncbi:MAG: hypothetical protein C6I01_02310 [Epsilonproteobacteria bacterium]|nr:hypothetical protein [Campylobacterota bacterium]